MSMAQAARRQEDDESEIHRLRDIEAREVSLVDRAANKRRFLVVKRDDENPDDEDDDEEEDESKEKAQSAGDEDDAKPSRGRRKKKPSAASEAESTEKARKTPRPDEDDEDEQDSAETEKSDGENEQDGDEEDEDEDEEDGKESGSAAGRSRAARRKGKSSAGSDSGGIVGLSSVLTKAIERLQTLAEGLGASVKAGQAATASSLASGGGSAGSTAAAPEASSKAPVEKAGARMSRDRLDRFQKAMTLLSDILKEITDAKEDAPAASAFAANGVAKRDSSAAPLEIAGVKELTAGIAELTEVVKRQEEELTRIRQARGVSNAITVDGGGRRREAQEVSWPLDMNRPISRDSVGKAVSFYE
jgi:hypothetical protein